MLQVAGTVAEHRQLADTHGAISHRRRDRFNFVPLIFFQINYLTQLFRRLLFGLSHILTNFEPSSCKRQSIQHAEGGR